MSSYGAKAMSASYASGPFASIPRKIAGVSISCDGGSPTFNTSVRFSLRPESGSRLEDKDGEKESVGVSYSGDNSRNLVSFLGKSGDKVKLVGLRKAATAAVNKLRALKVTQATFEIPEVEGIPSGVVAGAVVQASLLSNFAFDRYLTLEKASLLTSLHFKCASPEQESAA